MSVPVTISDLQRDGVRLVSPLDPEFDGIARSLIGRQADRLLRLKPLMVALTNDTPKTVAAASVVFRVAKPVGGLVAWTNVAFPEVAIGNLGASRRLGIRPNESLVVALAAAMEGFDDPEHDDWFRDLIDQLARERDEQLKDAQSVTIELDAVIFDDETLIGRDDDGRLASLFAVRVSAYQRWLHTIADGLAAGKSVESACVQILKFRDEVRARQGSLSGIPPDRMLAEIEKTNAAADIVKWRGRIGDADLPRALAGLRLTQLLIHR